MGMQVLMYEYCSGPKECVIDVIDVFLSLTVGVFTACSADHKNSYLLF